jgi:hypothetical protein
VFADAAPVAAVAAVAPTTAFMTSAATAHSVTAGNQRLRLAKRSRRRRRRRGAAG